jgi:hypothetical protein
MARTLVPFAVTAMLLSLAGCSATPTVVASPRPTETATTAVQDLTLVGKLPDRWTTAEVDCSGGGSGSLSVSLTGGAQRRAVLTIDISSGYSGPGEYAETGGPDGKPAAVSVTLQPDGDSGPVAISTSNLPVTITVLEDKTHDKAAAQTMGRIDASLGQQANPVDAIEYVTGTWRCGA